MRQISQGWRCALLVALLACWTTTVVVAQPPAKLPAPVKVPAPPAVAAPSKPALPAAAPNTVESKPAARSAATSAPVAAQKPSKAPRPLYILAASPREAAAHAATLKALEQDIQLDFEQVPLGEAVLQMSKLLGVPVQLDRRALASISVSEATPFDCRASKITAGAALTQSLGQLGLIWTIHDESLVITTESAGYETNEVRVYPVGDLLTLQTNDGERNRDGLIQLIESTISPASWDDVGGAGTIKASDDALCLVVAQPLALQQQVAELIDGLRKTKQATEQKPLRADDPTSKIESRHIAGDRQARAHAAICRALDAELTLKSNGMLLPEFAEMLGKQLSAPVFIDRRALKRLSIKLDIAVDCDVGGLSGRSALKQALSPLALTWHIANESLTITTIEEPEFDTPVKEARNEFRGKTDGDNNRFRFETRIYTLDNFWDGDVSTQTAGDSITKTITLTIAPTAWDDVGGQGSIRYFPAISALVVAQTRETQERIEQLLQSLRIARQAAMDP